MVIFHSYVSLPESTSPMAKSFPGKSGGVSPAFHQPKNSAMLRQKKCNFATRL